MIFCIVCKSILILISSTYFSNSFVTLPRAPKTAGITSILLRFQSLWISLLNLLLLPFNYSHIPRYCSIYNYCCLLYFIANSNLLSYFHNEIVTLYIHVPYSVTVWGLSRYHFSDFLRLNLSHSFQGIILATLSWLLLYSLWAIFEHSLTIWVPIIVAPISPNILQEGESTLLSMWYLTYLIVCSGCLFLCRAYQGLTWYFWITFSQPEPLLSFVCAFRHISNKLFIHLFFFPVLHPFLIQRFFKVSLWTSVSWHASFLGAKFHYKS